MLDLRQYFGGSNGRYIQDPAWWQSRVLPDLRTFLATAAAAENRPLHLNLAAHSSIAFAAGYFLNSKSGFDITLRQRGQRAGEWRADAGAAVEGPFFAEEPDRLRDVAALDVALAVGISNPVVEDVEAYLNRTGWPVRRILPATLAKGTGQGGVRDGLHAMVLAEDLAQRIRRRTSAEREGVLHLFISAPNALLFFLGQIARNFGRVQLYEYEFGTGRLGAYRPSILLPAGGARD
ncbi:MAG TPA: SAVED domain-containing protein [Thermoanaerobaculia bacterium]|nr:SAVED domain-containing protein [Thermoanaerobaculia bacterium]